MWAILYAYIMYCVIHKLIQFVQLSRFLMLVYREYMTYVCVCRPHFLMWDRKVSMDCTLTFSTLKDIHVGVFVSIFLCVCIFYREYDMDANFNPWLYLCHPQLIAPDMFTHVRGSYVVIISNYTTSSSFPHDAIMLPPYNGLVVGPYALFFYDFIYTTLVYKCTNSISNVFLHSYYSSWLAVVMALLGAVKQHVLTTTCTKLRGGNPFLHLGHLLITVLLSCPTRYSYTIASIPL
jgi:hypothetical protein